MWRRTMTFVVKRVELQWSDLQFLLLRSTTQP